ncbi:hypothetical protein C8R42DRAFT_718903 [Lentinula raphanica]|nr:hypothetical protein C8R42DRAFT_718903 [Lentinula raphanica]
MPAFRDRRTNGLLETTNPTIARKCGETDDWAYFYVGIFVDRNMFMRYFPGGGVGHIANRKFFTDMNSTDGDSDEDNEQNPTDHEGTGLDRDESDSAGDQEDDSWNNFDVDLEDDDVMEKIGDGMMGTVHSKSARTFCYNHRARIMVIYDHCLASTYHYAVSTIS